MTRRNAMGSASMAPDATKSAVIAAAVSRPASESYGMPLLIR